MRYSECTHGSDPVNTSIHICNTSAAHLSPQRLPEADDLDRCPNRPPRRRGTDLGAARAFLPLPHCLKAVSRPVVRALALELVLVREPGLASCARVTCRLVVGGK